MKPYISSDQRQQKIVTATAVLALLLALALPSDPPSADAEPRASLAVPTPTRPKDEDPSFAPPPIPPDPVIALPGNPLPLAADTAAQLTKDEAGYIQIGFAQLANFPFTPQPAAVLAAAKSRERLPEIVRSLDGARVCIRGFMLPLKMENGRTTEFIILRNTLACCFGVPPGPNEWVVVRMTGPGASAVQDQPLRFYGTMHVGETYENGEFAGLYRLDGEKVTADSGP